jgi:hypothetical protein
MMSEIETAFKEIQRIAHELVDAESLPAFERPEQIVIERARRNALDCMRLIGKRQWSKIGQAEDWST